MNVFPFTLAYYPVLTPLRVGGGPVSTLGDKV